MTKKHIVKGGTTRKAILGFLAIIGLMLSTAHAGYMNITSVPEASEVQPGQVYKLRIVADSTDVPSEAIIAASWHVNVPAGVAVTGAEFPSQNNPSTNPDDFFYGVLMKTYNNFIDSSVDSSGELTDNARGCHTWDGGTQNRIGDLGWYYFTVNPSLMGQTLNFGLNDVYFLNSNTNNVPYNVTNSQFTVIPEPATVLLLWVGAVMMRSRRSWLVARP